MSRSAKVEELTKLLDAGALTRDEYQDAVRRIDEEEAEQEKARKKAEADALGETVRPPEEGAGPVKKTKPYQTKRVGEWTYQDRSFPELEEEDPLEHISHWLKIGGVALGVAALLFLGPALCSA